MQETTDPSWRALVGALELNGKLFENCFANVDDETARRRFGAQTNNMAFIGCHLVDARHFLARLIGAEAGSSFGGRLDEIESIDEASDLPSVTEIRQAWSKIGSLLERRASSMTSEELAQEVVQEFPIADPTLRGALVFMLGHESFHLGQLALLRKHFGLGAMSWATQGHE
jgi:uncharacterized damage-inducible protein DinB